MFYFINNTIEYFDFELDENYQKGETFEDSLKGFPVRMSEEQEAFMMSYPEASLKEVFDMKLNEHSEEETLANAKKEKVSEIISYDLSDNVNVFTLNGEDVWIDADTRNNYRTSIDAAEILNEEDITFKIGDIVATIPLQSAKIMLAQIQRYADACFLVTEQHKANVMNLTSLEEVELYDFSVNYPEKLVFSL